MKDDAWSTPSSPPQGASRRGVGSDLPLRLASAAVLAPLALGAAYLGGGLFALFWLLAGLGVLWEWHGLLSGVAVAPGESRRAVLAGGVALMAAAASLAFGWPWIAAGLLGLGAVAAGAVMAPRHRGWSAAGVLYAGTIALGPAVLRGDAQFGLLAVLVLFAVVWTTDIAAYFGGRLLGGPRLWERVSPKKTWSGALVGTGLGAAAGTGVAAAGGLRDLGLLALICVLLSVASQAGDLWESALKRRFGAKDSGAIIPGHGGLMDRLDGFVAATFAAAVVGLARGGWDAPSRGLLIW